MKNEMNLFLLFPGGEGEKYKISQDEMFSMMK